MKRYSIMVKEYGSDHYVELMQVETNPHAITKGLWEKTLKVAGKDDKKKKSKLQQYTDVWVRDNCPNQSS